MNETNISKVNHKEPVESTDSTPLKENKENQRLRQELHGNHEPIGIVQRIKPKKQETVGKIATLPDHLIDESEEFDSDQHVENENDWHPELDIVAMPHLLGPSATRHSPAVPAAHQHVSTFSAPPFSCQQILVEFGETGPTFSLVPCSHYRPNYDVNTEAFNHNQYQPFEQFNPHFF